MFFVDDGLSDHGTEQKRWDSTANAIPFVLLNDRDDQVNEHGSYQIEFEKKYVQLKKLALVNAEASIPAHLLFAGEVISGIFGLLIHALQFSPASVAHKQLCEVCSLLHEFYSCNGFMLFSSLLENIAALHDKANQLNGSKRNLSSSPTSSPVKSPFTYSASNSKFRPETAYGSFFINLLSSYERLIATIQKLKVEYLHKVGCSRQNHKSCDLRKLVPIHHPLLGDEANYQNKSNGHPSSTFSSINDHLKKISSTTSRQVVFKI